MGSPWQRIVWPDAPGADDPTVVGPKAAALVRVARCCSDGTTAAAMSAVSPVPLGFVVSTAAWREVLAVEGLRERLAATLDASPNDEPRAGGSDVAEVHGSAVAARELLLGATLPEGLREELREAHDRLVATWSGSGGFGGTSRPSQERGPVLLAVRSSATAEDLPGASFAGQYDSHLGVHGPEQLLDAYRAVLSSAYSDRALAYRRARGIGPLEVEMAVSVQVLVRADLGGAAGVLFSRDPEDPTSDRTLVEAVRGFGEALVSGTADPDRYVVGRHASGPRHADDDIEVVRSPGADRPALTDPQLRLVVDQGRRLEAEWGRPVDVEWAIDGPSGELVLLQCRPLGVGRVAASGQDADTPASGPGDESSTVLARGLAVGTGVAGGTARRIDDPLDPADFHDGDVLVTAATDPSWLGLMQRAGALVTDHGGRTSHAAIVSRELGLLAVVGCRDATDTIRPGTEVRIACTSNGLGVVYGADESG